MAKLSRPEERIFGEIHGIQEGTVFPDRAALAAAGIHNPTQAGISGSKGEGADSIVLSGGYEDDEDFGDEVVYTGHGGQDPNTREHIADQELTRQNLALAVSMQRGLPVRVTRGAKLDSEYSPESGYRYDGLYRVDEMWHETGKAGFRVFRFRLIKLGKGEVPKPTPKGKPGLTAGGSSKPGRSTTTVVRVIRDTALSRQIKELYNYTCQMCGVRLEGPGGPYAEAAHIRPLGRPHEGPDVPTNIICLCPNHHVLFDRGGVAIGDDLSLVGMEGRLSVHGEHSLDLEYVRYHREHYFRANG